MYDIIIAIFALEILNFLLLALYIAFSVNAIRRVMRRNKS